MAKEEQSKDVSERAHHRQIDRERRSDRRTNGQHTTAARAARSHSQSLHSLALSLTPAASQLKRRREETTGSRRAGWSGQARSGQVQARTRID